MPLRIQIPNPHKTGGVARLRRMRDGTVQRVASGGKRKKIAGDRPSQQSQSRQVREGEREIDRLDQGPGRFQTLDCVSSQRCVGQHATTYQIEQGICLKANKTHATAGNSRVVRLPFFHFFFFLFSLVDSTGRRATLVSRGRVSYEYPGSCHRYRREREVCNGVGMSWRWSSAARDCQPDRVWIETRRLGVCRPEWTLPLLHAAGSLLFRTVVSFPCPSLLPWHRHQPTAARAYYTALHTAHVQEATTASSSVISRVSSLARPLPAG